MESLSQWLSPGDPSSFSRPEECLVTRLHLDLDVDFSAKILQGSVQLDISKVLPSATQLILDTRDLVIHAVKRVSDGKLLHYELGPSSGTFGSPLRVTVPSDTSSLFSVVIEYSTVPSCSALQWLTPEQTAGKKHPYLFSQCQAIHARSMVPCQDTPGVKAPYSAMIRTPSDLVALMSAVRKGSAEGDAGKTRHQFEQAVPIPSYLIALAVGALDCRDIGPRSKVWSEREMIDACAYEFGETEKMLSTAEDIVGPYEWGVYDLLILPPSFPYGGMENPCLTFVTPTILAGDRSLALLVGHEIAHSWTGNLVTNRNPEHFWLNEGHTVFLERKIAGRMTNESVRHMFAYGGWNSLKLEVPHMHQPYTHLVPDLSGVDPDDAFSIVPYEKGSALLMYLEQKVGGPAVFEPFLKAYVKEFRFKSIDTSDWKNFLYKFFDDKKSLLDEIDWNDVFYSAGMPKLVPKYDTTLTDACVLLAQRWCEADDKRDESALAQFSARDIDKFTPHQLTEFLGQLLDRPPLAPLTVTRLDKLYQLSAKNNSEIKFRWLRLCLLSRIESVIPVCLDFVNSQGRMKFVRPLYRALYAWEDARQIAVDNYSKHKAQMHPLTATMVGKDLRL